MKIISKSLLSTLCFSILAFGAQAKETMPLLTALPHESFSLEGIVDDECSEPFAIHIGKFTVEMIQEKKGLKYFKLHGKGILINSGFMHKNVNSNPYITYTVPDSSKIENGSVLSLHAFKKFKNEDGSFPMHFYVLCDKILQKSGKASPGIIRQKEQ